MVAWPWLVVVAVVAWNIGYGWPEIIVRAVRKVREARRGRV